MASVSRERGFTLVELLVVVVIIGLLASIIIASLTALQTKARDTRRIADIDTMRKALAIYAASGSLYPVATTQEVMNLESAAMQALIAERAISVIPQDPLSPVYQYEYQTNALGTTYTIFFCLETDSIRNYSAGCDNTISP